MRHPRIGSLIAYAEQLLSGERGADLDGHIQACSKCAVEASEWLGLLGLMKAKPLQSATDDAVQRCMAIYQLSQRDAERVEKVARVVLDSETEQHLAGVRGLSDSRQIHLQTKDTDIHLCVLGDPRVLVGQLMARPGGDFVRGARVELIHGNESIEMTVTDALGEFRIANVPTGESRIQTHLASGECLVGSFTIKAENNQA